MPGILSPRVLFFVAILVGALPLPNSIQAQGKSDTPAGEKGGRDAAVLLEHARFLREEEKAHRDFLESLYTRTLGLLAILVTAGIAAIAYFNFKSREDVRKEVAAQLSQAVTKEVAAQLSQVVAKEI